MTNDPVVGISPAKRPVMRRVEKEGEYSRELLTAGERLLGNGGVAGLKDFDVLGDGELLDTFPDGLARQFFIAAKNVEC
jgi:hypothetical protein